MLWKQKHAKFAPLPLCVPRFTSRSCRDFRSIILWIRSTLSYTTRLNTLNQELVFISLTVSDKLGRYTCTRHRRTRFRLSELSHNVWIKLIQSNTHRSAQRRIRAVIGWIQNRASLIDSRQSFLLVTSRFCVCLVYYVIAKWDGFERETRVRLLMWFRPYLKK